MDVLKILVVGKELLFFHKFFFFAVFFLFSRFSYHKKHNSSPIITPLLEGYFIGQEAVSLIFVSFFIHNSQFYFPFYYFFFFFCFENLTIFFFFFFYDPLWFFLQNANVVHYVFLNGTLGGARTAGYPVSPAQIKIVFLYDNPKKKKIVTILFFLFCLFFFSQTHGMTMPIGQKVASVTWPEGSVCFIF